MDEVREYPAAMTTAKGLPGRLWSHLFSSLLGDEGHDELEAFTRTLKLRPAWLQHKGRPTEHYDVVPSVRARALRNGAVEVNSRLYARARLQGQQAVDTYIQEVRRPVFGGQGE